ncbi:MAG: hypothetical protein ACQESR_16765 [Planctomycetota bacterium]
MVRPSEPRSAQCFHYNFRPLDFSGWKAARRKPSSRWSDSRAEKVIRDRYTIGKQF